MGIGGVFGAIGGAAKGYSGALTEKLERERLQNQFNTQQEGLETFRSDSLAMDATRNTELAEQGEYARAQDEWTRARGRRNDMSDRNARDFQNDTNRMRVEYDIAKLESGRAETSSRETASGLQQRAREGMRQLEEYEDIAEKNRKAKAWGFKNGWREMEEVARGGSFSGVPIYGMGQPGVGGYGEKAGGIYSGPAAPNIGGMGGGGSDILSPEDMAGVQEDIAAERARQAGVGR